VNDDSVKHTSSLVYMRLIAVTWPQ